jgi:GxxExxY protein
VKKNKMTENEISSIVVILEIKSVEKIIEVHGKQVLTYLKITKMKLGLLINFNVPIIKLGIKRVVSNL